MELPTLPANRGHSKGIRQRVERSLPAVRAAVCFLDVANEALHRKFGEPLSHLPARREVSENRRERYVSVPAFMLYIGRDIERKRDAMVRADLALAAQRRIRRQAFERRDQLKQQLYTARVELKKEARRKLGKRRFKVMKTLGGETLRDPEALILQATHAVTWASGPLAPATGIDGRPMDWAARAAPLATLVKDLQAAVDDVYHQDSDVIQKLCDRDDAVKAFDEKYGKGTRSLEATYVLFGLPTLALAVRPHLKVAGRVGRPSKAPPVDDYPDLVERVRAAGFLPESVPERQAAAAPDEQHRLAVWIAAYRQAIVPYLSFLAGISTGRIKPEGTETATAAPVQASVAAWPARLLARWRRKP